MPLALFLRALLAMFFMASGAPAASGQPLRAVPALQARVIDQTGTLSESQRQMLEASLAAVEQQHGSQVVVLMVPTTAPEDISSFANRVGDTWKIGRRDVGDGVLIVVAKDDRRMRIEVAKALEGAIPDIAAARIIDGAMKPRFREGDFAGGLESAVQQISARIGGEALPAPQAGPSGDWQGSGLGRGAPAGFDWTDLAAFLFFGVVVAGPVARRLLGPSLGGIVTGTGAGLLAFIITSSLFLAGGVGLLALFYTWIFAGRGIPVIWHGGGGGGGGSGGWGGGGFGSGGGGDFGGGGASGDW
ncbi:TPM domain-containing protein [Diaphorobacter sp.]|uniref:TPM domain-containing protein n=1 Tax=Diaphorobacter sp. TaxID=1934310 RepID=UPI003D0C606E